MRGMSDTVAYLAIAALAVLVMIVANRTSGMSPLLSALAQILVVVAAVTMIEPLGAKPVVALVVAYYGGFFMGRAFEQEKAKPRREALPRGPKGQTGRK
jgi:CHASE2 domain-containing sensor protein